jgi:hypothetical protein
VPVGGFGLLAELCLPPVLEIMIASASSILEQCLGYTSNLHNNNDYINGYDFGASLLRQRDFYHRIKKRILAYEECDGYNFAKFSGVSPLLPQADTMKDLTLFPTPAPLKYIGISHISDHEADKRNERRLLSVGTIFKLHVLCDVLCSNVFTLFLRYLQPGYLQPNSRPSLAPFI